MTETDLPSVAADPTARRNRLIVLGLILLTLACYWPVGKFGFVNYDDDVFVTDNGAVRQGITPASLKYAFTSYDGNCWQPLTWISHMLNVELFGPKIGGHNLADTFFHTGEPMPAGHHLVNVLLHIADTLLLWQLLRRMTGAVWPSAWVAAIFAVHPLHVESVAWVTERKDVLSTLFFLLTILAYHRYVQQISIGRYLLVVLAFAAALMSKPMTVTTPCVLLLLDIWPLNRVKIGPEFWKSLGRAVMDKLPLLLLSVGSSFITIYGSHANGSLVDLQSKSLAFRLETSIIAYARYLGKLVWPTNLAVFYPFPESWPMGWVIGATILFVVLTALAIWQVKRRPFVLIGWLWFVGTLVPVIGLVVTGDASLADRYMYVPSIGLLIAIAWLGAQAADRLRPILIGLGVITIAGCVALTGRQVWYWQDSLALFGHTLAITSPSMTANNNYGCALTDRDREDEAGPYFVEALRLEPDTALPNINYARFLLDKNKLDEALPYLTKANKANPGDLRYLLQEARAREMRGKHEDSIKILEYVLNKKPFSADAEMAMATSLISLGKLDAAEPHLRKAIEIDPAQALAYHRLGLIAAQRNDPAAAVDNFEKAISLRSALGIAHLDYGVTLARLGRYKDAIDQLQLASTTLKDNELHEKSLAELMIGQIIERFGRPLEAAVHYLKAVDIANQAVAASPKEARPLYNLAITLKRVGRGDEALATAKKAMQDAVAVNNLYMIGEIRTEFPQLAPPPATTRSTTQPAIAATQPAQNPK